MYSTIINSEASPPGSVKDENKMEKDGNKETLEIPVAVEPTKPNYELSKFKLVRILQNNTLRKTIALLGTFPDVSDIDVAVVFLEKEAFQDRDVQTDAERVVGGSSNIFNDALQVQTLFINNIYGSFQCVPNTDLNGIKTTVVYPATYKHIEKYSITEKYVVSESPELYKELTLPFITSSQFTLDWVYNILEHHQETDRIVYEDKDPQTGFILLPDLKWDGETVETLYMLAIVHKRDLKSLRDLNDTHLPMLRNLRDGIAATIKKRYGLVGTQLRMYFHYQPSFYHLHLHINPVRSDAPGIWCEKSHMLNTVISNIELMPNYYQRVTLPFVLFEGSKLLEEYDAKNMVRKPVKNAPKESDISDCEKLEVKLKAEDFRNDTPIELPVNMCKGEQPTEHELKLNKSNVHVSPAVDPQTKKVKVNESITDEPQAKKWKEQPVLDGVVKVANE